MDRKKVLNWVSTIVIVVILIFTLDGGWLWLGIGGVLVASLVLATIKMWHGRKQLKMVLTMASDLGKMHKELSKKPAVPPATTVEGEVVDAKEE